MTHESTWPPYEEEAEQKGNQNKREEKEEQEEVEDGKTAGDWHWQVQLRGVKKIKFFQCKILQIKERIYAVST